MKIALLTYQPNNQQHYYQRRLKYGPALEEPILLLKITRHMHHGVREYHKILHNLGITIYILFDGDFTLSTSCLQSYLKYMTKWLYGPTQVCFNGA